MSWAKPNSAIDQIGETDGVDTSGAAQHVFAFKAPYGDLETAKDALKQGDPIVADKWIAKSWDLARIPGGWGELKITCVPPDPTSGSGESKQTLPLEDLWTVRSCRNDVSLLAYCGISPGNNPNRGDIEMWLKETDKALYDAYQFKDGEGQVRELSAPSQALAAKFQKGVQSVMRFYPMLTRKRVYSGQPPACLENLACIDAPGTPGEGAKHPGGVDAAIGEHQWLKCQDDATQRPDNKWERVESWMGIRKADAEDGNNPWDENLYGTTNRWTMPYNAT